MPATPSPDVRRGRVPQVLFWAGMGLAPLAVLILLFGQSTGSLRVAVVLAVLTIVLLAISIALRPSVDMVRVDIEHRVLDEMERIRLRVREETANATRSTQRALTDRIAVLDETVQHLRAQVDEVQANAALFDPAALGYVAPPALEAPVPPGTIRRTETVQVTRRTTYDDTGTIYGSRAASERAVDAEWREERDEPDDRPWMLGRPDPPALPPAWGQSAGRFYDRSREPEPYGRSRLDPDRPDRDRPDCDRPGHDRHDRDRPDRDRYDRDHGYERDHGPDRGFDRDRPDWDRPDWDRPKWDRGPDRDRYDRDHHDRDHHDRDRLDRDRYDRDRLGRDSGPDRYEREPGYDRGDDRYDPTRGSDRDRGHDRGRGYEADRDWGPDRGYRDRGPERGYDRGPDPEPAYDRRYDRGHEREPYDRPRGPERGYEPRSPQPRGYEPRDHGPHGYGSRDHDPHGHESHGYESHGFESRGYESRGYDAAGPDDRGYDPRGYHGERGPDRLDRDGDRPPVPRPRYPQW